jgi:hypothetical protein
VRRIILFATIVLIALACGTTQASEWVSVGKTEDAAPEVFVDVSSIRITGVIRRAWVKHVFQPHSERGVGEDQNKWESETLNREAFNCSEESIRIEALTIYYEGGGLSSAPAADSPTPWEPVAPDTVGSVKMHFICAWKPK